MLILHQTDTKIYFQWKDCKQLYWCTTQNHTLMSEPLSTAHRNPINFCSMEEENGAVNGLIEKISIFYIIIYIAYSMNNDIIFLRLSTAGYRNTKNYQLKYVTNQWPPCSGNHGDPVWLPRTGVLRAVLHSAGRGDGHHHQRHYHYHYIIMTAGDGHDDAGELHDQLHPLLHHVQAVPHHLQVNNGL